MGGGSALVVHNSKCFTIVIKRLDRNMFVQWSEFSGEQFKTKYHTV